MFQAIKVTIGLRLSREEELLGADAVEHNIHYNAPCLKEPLGTSPSSPGAPHSSPASHGNGFSCRRRRRSSFGFSVYELDRRSSTRSVDRTHGGGDSNTLGMGNGGSGCHYDCPNGGGPAGSPIHGPVSSPIGSPIGGSFGKGSRRGTLERRYSLDATHTNLELHPYRHHHHLHLPYSHETLTAQTSLETVSERVNCSERGNCGERVNGKCVHGNRTDAHGYDALGYDNLAAIHEETQMNGDVLTVAVNGSVYPNDATRTITAF
jgi:hypothetical protein